MGLMSKLAAGGAAAAVSQNLMQNGAPGPGGPGQPPGYPSPSAPPPGGYPSGPGGMAPPARPMNAPPGQGGPYGSAPGGGMGGPGGPPGNTCAYPGIGPNSGYPGAPPPMPGGYPPQGPARPPGGPMPGGPGPYPAPGGPPYQQQQQQGGPPPYGSIPGGSSTSYPPYPQQPPAAAPSGPGARPMGPPGGPGQYGGPPHPAAGGPGVPYGGPAPGMPPGGSLGGPGGMVGAIQAKLTAIINANQLQRFYPPQNIPALAARVDQRVNFTDLAARWRMPKELAIDLACLALYDIVMFVDDSGSMAFEENGERIEDLKLIASKVAEVATMFDDDGILMRFMNSPLEGNGLRSIADVENLLARVQYSGMTPLAASLQSRVLQPIVYSLAGSGQLAKPVLIITITDGEPTDNPKDMVVQVIRDVQYRLAMNYGPRAVAFEFAQVGKDHRAQAFLSRLDTDPQVGASIDCTSYYEMEQSEYAKKGVQLTPEAWLVKMMVGAIDSSYDEQDEG